MKHFPFHLDALIQRLHAVHPTNLEKEEDGNDALLQEIEKNSRASSNNNMNVSANSIRTSPRITQTDGTNIQFNVDKVEEIGKLFPKEPLNSTPVKNFAEKFSGKSQEKQLDLPKRSYSELHVMKNSSSNKGTSQRSQSEGNVLDIEHLTTKVSNLDVKIMEPGKNEKKFLDHSSAFIRSDSENNGQSQQDNGLSFVKLPL